jgi:hypothetical protein
MYIQCRTVCRRSARTNIDIILLLFCAATLNGVFFQVVKNLKILQTFFDSLFLGGKSHTWAYRKRANLTSHEFVL